MLADFNNFFCIVTRNHLQIIYEVTVKIKVAQFFSDSQCTPFTLLTFCCNTVHLATHHEKQFGHNRDVNEPAVLNVLINLLCRLEERLLHVLTAANRHDVEHTQQ